MRIYSAARQFLCILTRLFSYVLLFWLWSGWRCAICFPRSGGVLLKPCATARSPPMPWASAPIVTRWRALPWVRRWAVWPADSMLLISNTCNHRALCYELMVILLLGVVLGGRKSLWGAFFGASLVALLPNLLSNRFLFLIISAVGLLAALLAGVRGSDEKDHPAVSGDCPDSGHGFACSGRDVCEKYRGLAQGDFCPDAVLRGGRAA